MKQLVSLAILFSLLISCKNVTDECMPVDLVCEYLVDPIGVDQSSPRLKWKINDQREGASQHAFRIYVGTDSLDVTRRKGDMWNSRIVISDAMLVPYEGRALKPFTKYYWTCSALGQRSE